MSNDVDVVNAILQNQLSDDVSVVRNLPYIITAISKRNLECSPHLARWLNRVNSLLHSKDTGARWAGLCLALETSRSSVEILLNVGQGWVTTVLPLLSKQDVFPTLTAAIRLLTFIFSSTSTFPEFQRQVTAPNVVKYTTALVSLIEKQNDVNFKCLCLDSISVVLPLYPALHRPILANLSALALRLLDGSHLSPTPDVIIRAASQLYASLHTTGGKVGGSALWRKNIDETIAFCATALASSRVTYSQFHQPSHHPSNLDPFSTIALNVDRLRCGIKLLCKLLQTAVSRPVAVPIRTLTSLCNDLLLPLAQVEPPEEVNTMVRASENLFFPKILSLGCELLLALILCVRRQFSAYLGRSLSLLAFQLEQGNVLPLPVRTSFVHVLNVIFNEQLVTHDRLLVGRIIKSVLPALTPLLSQKNDVKYSERPLDGGNKRGKKRTRGFEGDEIFSSGNSVSIASPEEGQLVLSTLQLLPALLRTPDIPEYLRSLTSKVILSLLMVLPEQPDSSISSDPTLKGKVLSVLNDACIDLITDDTTILNTNIALALSPVAQHCVVDSQNARKTSLIMDLLLHPRVPPLLQVHQPLNAAILGVESVEERTARENLGLSIRHAGLESSLSPSSISAPSSGERASLAQSTLLRDEQASERMEEIPTRPQELLKPVQQPVRQEQVLSRPPEEQEQRAIQAKPVELVVESNKGDETRDYFPPAPLTEPRQPVNKAVSSEEPGTERMDDDSDDEEMPVLDPASDSEEE